MSRWPRTAAALSFGVAASAVSSSWFLPSVLARRDPAAFLLFIAAPGAAAAVAGAIGGASLCDPTRTRASWQAILRGVGIATLAVVLFAPLFGLLYQWTAPGQISVIGLTVAVFTFSLLAVWWVAAAVGAAVGWLLYRLGARRFAVS